MQKTRSTNVDIRVRQFWLRTGDAVAFVSAGCGEADLAQGLRGLA